MAGNSIRVNTDQVNQIASNLESLNTKLRDELENSRGTVNSLKNVWEGEAAEATISAFNDFAELYFVQYEDVIKQYVAFLRRNVAEGYFETETANINLADAFK